MATSYSMTVNNIKSIQQRHIIDTNLSLELLNQVRSTKCFILLKDLKTVKSFSFFCKSKISWLKKNHKRSWGTDIQYLLGTLSPTDQNSQVLVIFFLFKFLLWYQGLSLQGLDILCFRLIFVWKLEGKTSGQCDKQIEVKCQKWGNFSGEKWNL